jgi:hypothetical protein
VVARFRLRLAAAATHRGSAGHDSRVLGMRKYAHCRDWLPDADGPQPLRLAAESGHTETLTASGAEQSDRSPMTMVGGDLLFLSHGYPGAGGDSSVARFAFPTVGS